jgi:hypothetical protein
MLARQCLVEILDRVRGAGGVRVVDLATEFRVSEVTCRAPRARPPRRPNVFVTDAGLPPRAQDSLADRVGELVVAAVAA